MVLGSHAKTRAMYSTPPWPSLTASTAAYRRRSFSDNHPKKRCIFSSISAEYPSMLYSLRHNLLWRKDTTAQACREVIPDHILISLFTQSECFCRIARRSWAMDNTTSEAHGPYTDNSTLTRWTRAAYSSQKAT